MRKFLILMVCVISATAWADNYRSFTDNQGRTIKAKIIRVDILERYLTYNLVPG